RWAADLTAARDRRQPDHRARSRAAGRARRSDHVTPAGTRSAGWSSSEDARRRVFAAVLANADSRFDTRLRRRIVALRGGGSRGRADVVAWSLWLGCLCWRSD